MRQQQIFATICRTIVEWLNAPAPPPVDWPVEIWSQFQLVCRVHGIAPRLHTKLHQSPWLPAVHRQWLRAQYTLNQERLAIMHEELHVILSSFADHDIPILPLKGTALSALVYEEPGLRPMADLDLLIRPSDMVSSHNLLAQLNYQVLDINWKHAEFVKTGNDRVFTRRGEHPQNPRKVDLHLYCREMFSGPVVDLTEQMWSTAVIRMDQERPTHWPHLEMLWRHILIHTGNNVWNENLRLINLIDIITLAERLPEPPPPPADEARFSYLALALCERYFPARLPPSWPAAVDPHVPRPVRRWVRTLDLVNSSNLKKKPAKPFLAKWFLFHRGRPQALWQALRFVLLPSRQVRHWERRRAGQRLPALWFRHFVQMARLVLKLLRPSS